MVISSHLDESKHQEATQSVKIQGLSRHLERKLYRPRSAHHLLTHPQPLLNPKRQLKMKQLPKELLAHEGLDISTWPCRKGLAGVKNILHPMERRHSTRFIVVHNTGNEGRKGNLRIIAKDRLAHFFVDRQGQVFQMVPHLGRQSNHVGRRVAWGKLRGLAMKDCSIGIEFLGNPNKRPPTAAQYASGGKLIRCLMRAYGIPATRVVSHGMVFAKKPFAKKIVRGGDRDIDGAHFVSPSGRRLLGIGAGPTRDANRAVPAPATKKLVFDPLHIEMKDLKAIAKANPVPESVPINRKQLRIAYLKETETLWRFSKRTGISLNSIYQCNKDIDPHKIPRFAKIFVPSKSTVG